MNLVYDKKGPLISQASSLSLSLLEYYCLQIGLALYTSVFHLARANSSHPLPVLDLVETWLTQHHEVGKAGLPATQVCVTRGALILHTFASMRSSWR